MVRGNSRFKDYVHRPEMRIFWLLSIFLIFAIILGFIYFPGWWQLLGVGIFVAAGIVIFIASKNLARANLEIKREEQLLNSVVANLSDAAVAQDESGRIIVFNKAAERLFGVSAAEMLGNVFSLERASREKRFELLGKAMYPSLAPVIIKRTGPASHPQIVEIVLENPFRELQITTEHIRSAKNEPIGLLRLIHDRTREIGLLKSKSEFITVASHQLRTPLTAISWTFQELQKPALAEGDRQQLVNTGNLAAAKLGKIINDFLDISKMEEGRFGYEFTPVNLADFISQVVNEASPIARQYKVNIYFEKPAEILVAPMDKAKMGIVFSNLLDNAIKYNVENGSVTIKARKLPNRSFAEIIISDTGVGITPEEMKGLFAKFFRTKMGMQKDATGSGLGLYLVRNIIHQHGGTITAESIEGRGTTFTFTLPTDINLIPQAETPEMIE